MDARFFWIARSLKLHNAVFGESVSSQGAFRPLGGVDWAGSTRKSRFQGLASGAGQQSCGRSPCRPKVALTRGNRFFPKRPFVRAAFLSSRGHGGSGLEAHATPMSWRAAFLHSTCFNSQTWLRKNASSSFSASASAAGSRGRALPMDLPLRHLASNSIRETKQGSRENQGHGKSPLKCTLMKFDKGNGASPLPPYPRLFVCPTSERSGPAPRHPPPQAVVAARRLARCTRNATLGSPCTPANEHRAQQVPQKDIILHELQSKPGSAKVSTGETQPTIGRYLPS